MLYMKKNFKIKGKIICEQKDFVFILFFVFIHFSPFLDDSNVTQMVCISRLLLQTFFFFLIVIYNSECIYNETQDDNNCSTVLYSWLTPLPVL